MHTSEYGFTKFVDCSKQADMFDEVPNADLPTFFENIAERTGIESRSIAKPGVTIEQLTHEALEALYHRLNISADDVQGVVLSSSNGKQETLQSIVESVANEHGIPGAKAVNYACSGFPAATEAALNTYNPEQKHIAIICAETLSQLVDWSDENTAILFGDGLAATTVAPSGTHEVLNAQAWEIHDPKHCLSIQSKPGTQLPDGSWKKLPRDVIHMGKAEGRALYKNVPKSLVEIVQQTDYGLEGINRIVPHQANGKFMGKMEQIIGSRADVTISNAIANQANTASATIPIALAHCLPSFSPGEMVACPAKGAGIEFEDGKLTEGIVVFRVGQ